MLCYKCGRLGYYEPQCPETITEPTNTPTQASDRPHPTAPSIEPTPWKTVQTCRTHVYTRQTEQLPCGKNSLPVSHSLGHPRGQNLTSHAAGQTQHLDSATDYNMDIASKTAGLERGEVANRNNSPLFRKPCEEGTVCMHAPCRADCPSLQTRLCDVAQDRLTAHATPSCPQAHVPNKKVQGMQQKNNTRTSPPESLPTSIHSENGFVLRPTFLDSHSNGPRPAPINHTLKQLTPACHSHHE